MAVVLKFLYKELYYYIEECKDPRTQDLFLIGSPIKVLSIIGLYLYFIKIWGPKFMQNREPYELKYTLIFYNLFQVISNLILATLGVKVLLTHWHERDCMRIDWSENGIFEASLFHYYYLLKVVDLLDTVFFVLRKKYNQISFLHVYHHSAMTFISYLVVKYIPGGHGGALGIINCYVHAIMYFYYFLTAFKPELKQSIWWKKHITQIQMIQFTILIYHFSRALFNPECNFPKVWLGFGVMQNIIMIVMFSDFYRKAYLKKKTK